MNCTSILRLSLLIAFETRCPSAAGARFLGVINMRQRCGAVAEARLDRFAGQEGGEGEAGEIAARCRRVNAAAAQSIKEQAASIGRLRRGTMRPVQLKLARDLGYIADYRAISMISETKTAPSQNLPCY